jgi:hypothetical protein
VLQRVGSWVLAAACAWIRQSGGFCCAVSAWAVSVSGADGVELAAAVPGLVSVQERQRQHEDKLERGCWCSWWWQADGRRCIMSVLCVRVA